MLRLTSYTCYIINSSSFFEILMLCLCTCDKVRQLFVSETHKPCGCVWEIFSGMIFTEQRKRKSVFKICWKSSVKKERFSFLALGRPKAHFSFRIYFILSRFMVGKLSSRRRYRLVSFLLGQNFLLFSHSETSSYILLWIVLGSTKIYQNDRVCFDVCHFCNVTSEVPLLTVPSLMYVLYDILFSIGFSNRKPRPI